MVRPSTFLVALLCAEKVALEVTSPALRQLNPEEVTNKCGILSDTSLGLGQVAR